MSPWHSAANRAAEQLRTDEGGWCSMWSRALKRIIVLSLILGMAAGLVFSQAAAQSTPRTFKLAFHHPYQDLWSEALRRFADQVTQETNGAINFHIYYSGSLVPAAQIFSAVQSGVADFGWVATSYISGQFPALAPLEIPGAVNTTNTLKINKELAPIINRLLKPAGVRYLWPIPSGDAGTFCHGKTLLGESSWKGAKVRTAGRWASRSVQVWGGSPVTLPIQDLYTGLQRRTVDCALFLYTSGDSYKLPEVSSDITLYNFSVNWTGIITSLKVWNSLTPQQQKAIDDAGQAAAAWVQDQTMSVEQQLPKKWEANGSMKVVDPTAAQRQELLSALKPVRDEACKNAGQACTEIEGILEKYAGPQ